MVLLYQTCFLSGWICVIFYIKRLPRVSTLSEMPSSQNKKINSKTTSHFLQLLCKSSSYCLYVYLLYMWSSTLKCLTIYEFNTSLIYRMPHASSAP